jgi:hypothetical protein
VSLSGFTNDLDLFSGSYNDLTDKPDNVGGTISYNDLTDTPTLFSGSYDDLTDKPEDTSSNYAPVDHTHDYLPLTGGEVTGNITCIQPINSTDSNYPGEFELVSRGVGDARWSLEDHHHDFDYATITHTHVEYASINHNHTWFQITGDQTVVNLSGFTNDLGSEVPGTISWNSITNKPVNLGVTYAGLPDKPTLFSGSYNDLTNKPILFSGSYNDLTGKPILFSGSYMDLTGRPTLFSGSYNDLTDIPDNLGGTISYNDLTDKPTLFSGSYNDLTDKPSTGASTWDQLSGNQSVINLSGFTNDLGQDLPGTISWNNIVDKPANLGGGGVGTWQELRISDSNTPSLDNASMGIMAQRSIFPFATNLLALGGVDNRWMSIWSTAGDINYLETSYLTVRNEITFDGGFVVENIDLKNDIRFKNSSGDTVARLKYHDDGIEVDGDMFPDGDKQFVLGTPGDRWKEIHGDELAVENIDLTNDIRFKDSSGNTVARLKYDDDGIEVDGHMFPDNDNDFVLGMPGNRWREIHGGVVAASNMVTDILTVETIGGPSFLFGPDTISVYGKKIENVGFPVLGSDAATKAYVDQSLFSTPIPWGFITGNDKPMMHTENFSGEKRLIAETHILPAEGDLFTNIGNGGRPFYNITCKNISIHNFAILQGSLFLQNNHIHDLAAPEEDDHAATKKYVDDLHAQQIGFFDIIRIMNLQSMNTMTVEWFEENQQTQLIFSNMKTIIRTNPMVSLDGQFRIVILLMNNDEFDQHEYIDSPGYTELYDNPIGLSIGRNYSYPQTSVSYPLNLPVGGFTDTSVFLAISVRIIVEVNGSYQEVEIAKYSYVHFADEIKPIVF